MWSKQGMTRLIIHYVQLDTQDIHNKELWTSVKNKNVM